MNAPAEHWNGPIREDTDGGGRRTPVKSLLNMALSILVSLLLLASAGFFYVAIQRDEMVTAQCMRAVESIRETQMLAAQWSVEVGKVKNEVNSNFDVLADFVDRMDPHIQVIHDSQNAMPNLPSDIKWALNGYIQRLKAREERIERFKSGFAIVRNSRRFIPREGMELAEAARDGGYGKVEAATRQILERTQSFLRQPTESQSQRMEQAMSRLAESAAGTPLYAQAETLNKHVSALLRHHGLTEQRFEDVMRTDLEDRAGRVIGLLDADHQQSRTKRRYFDYGFWASLGIAVFYWCTLVMQWMGRRRQRKAAAGAQEAVMAGGVPPHWGMDAALATAGGPGFPLEDAERAGEEERPDQSRRARGPARRAQAGEASAATGGRAGPTLMERLKARDGAHRTQPEESEREDARVQGAAVMERRDVPAPAGEEDGSAEPEPSLEERLEALKAELEAQQRVRAPETDRRARHGGPVPDDAGNAREQGAPVVEGRDVPADRDAGASGNGRASATLEERLNSLKTERDDRRAQHGGPVPEDAGEKGAAVTGGEWAQAPAGVAPAPAPAEGAPSMAQAPFAERTPADSSIQQAQARAGAAADVRGREADATPAPSQPDGSELVHQATREAILDRLQEIEEEIRAAADAAEQAEHTRRNKDGEGGDQDVAWTAAAGRMAGARWAVRALLKEVDRLPVPAAPHGAPTQVDMRDLVEKLLGALAGEDRKRIAATLVPGAVTRGNPQALEAATDIIVQHALEGARLHPGGEGYVTLTLVQESDGVHVTCLDHRPEGDSAGNRRSLALVVARSLIEGQGGEMEITPYPRYGTMVRLRLPPARSSM